MSQFSLRTVKTTYDAEKREWYAPAISPLYNSNVSLGQLVINALSARPDGIAQICHEDGHESKNWEILRDTVRAAISLHGLGLNEGDVLGFAAANSRHVAPIVFAALTNGYPVGTVNPNFVLPDVAHGFGITQPKIVFCDSSNYHHVKGALMQLNNPAPIYVFDENVADKSIGVEYLSVRELLKPQPEEIDFVAPYLTDGNLPAFITCTSGTTGIPKAIGNSHSSFASFMMDRSSSKYRRYFGFSALFWGSGIAVLLQGTLCNVPRVIVRKSFEPALGLEIIKKHQIEFMFCTPAQVQLMLQHESYKEGDLSSLKMAFCGGSMVPEWLEKQKTVPLITGYGSSEAGMISVMGYLGGGCVVKIVDDDNNRMGIGEQGEICSKTPFPFLGYYNDPAATKEIQIDGFVHTGDIGFFDEHLRLHVVDRKKDIFKYNNFHVSPSEVENAVKLPGIASICVMGIPDPIFDCLPAAAVVAMPGSKITETMVHEFVKQNLGQHNWLRGGVYLMEELPMTATGKVLRRTVRDMAKELYKKNPDIGFTY